MNCVGLKEVPKEKESGSDVKGSTQDSRFPSLEPHNAPPIRARVYFYPRDAVTCRDVLGTLPGALSPGCPWRFKDLE